MYIQHKYYLYKTYSELLKNKDLLLILQNKSFNSKVNFTPIKKNKTINLTYRSVNKSILKINFRNSIFITLKGLINVKLLICFLNKQNILDYTNLSSNSIFLIKLYNKVYTQSQFKNFKSLNYKSNVKLYLVNIKYAVNSLLNFIKIKEEFKKNI